MATTESMQETIKPDKYQKQVLNFIECGDSLFVTGKAGTGYKKMLLLINKEMPETYKQIVEFIQSL